MARSKPAVGWRKWFDTLAPLCLYAATVPGSLWLIPGWLPISSRLQLCLAAAVPGVVMGLSAWSLGMLYNRGFYCERPPWIVHPATRTVLIFWVVTFLVAWPFGLVETVWFRMFGVLVAPGTGFAVAMLSYILFGTRYFYERYDAAKERESPTEPEQEPGNPPK
jgi:hypothetical protein